MAFSSSETRADLVDSFLEITKAPGEQPSSIVRPSGTHAVVFNETLDGVATQFAIFKYTNRTLIIVTQCSRLGNLYLVTREGHFPLASPPSSAFLDVRCLLGVECSDTAVAVRSLGEKLPLNKPLLISLTITPPSIVTLNIIAQLILARL